MKIIKIVNCNDCPYLKQYMECGKTRMTVDTYPAFPHWCPLEDNIIPNKNKSVKPKRKEY